MRPVTMQVEKWHPAMHYVRPSEAQKQAGNLKGQVVNATMSSPVYGEPI